MSDIPDKDYEMMGKYIKGSSGKDGQHVQIHEDLIRKIEIHIFKKKNVNGRGKGHD